MTGGPPETRPEHHVLSLLAGKWISQAVSTAAALGIADVLADEPLDIAVLAQRVDCHPGMLSRLMLVLVGEGIFSFDETTERYGLTAAGALLRSGEDSLQELATFIGSPSQWLPWPYLPEALRSGSSAYEMAHGHSLYERMKTHTADAIRYDDGVDRFTAGVARAVADTYDCSEVETFVDVGGGLGTCAAALLARWEHLQGTLLELGHVLERAKARLNAAKVLERCECIEGNFFEKVPAGHDLYVLKHVLHNWPDADALRILRVCRDAARPDSTLLLVEGVLHPGIQRSMSRLMDLEMMVLFGQGRARTKADLRMLLRESGWALQQATFPLDEFARLLVAKPRT